MNRDSEDAIREGVKASAVSACLLEAALAFL
jgi:hypothetical protein